jgi:hypothetical protein
MGSPLAQLIQSHVEQSSGVQELLVTQKEAQLSPTSSLADCLNLLRLEAQVIIKTIFIIDTLDECDVTGGHRNEFLIGLRSLRSQVHILVTSRFDASIERELEFDSSTEIQANNDDVKLYINHHLAREPQLASHIKKDTKVRCRYLCRERNVPSCKVTFECAGDGRQSEESSKSHTETTNRLGYYVRPNNPKDPNSNPPEKLKS